MQIRETTVTILDTASLSDAVSSVPGRIDMEGFNLLSIQVPAAFAGTQISFEVCNTVDGTFKDLLKADNTELVLDVTPGAYNLVDPINTVGYNFLKVRSGISATAVPQTEDVAIILGFGNV